MGLSIIKHPYDLTFYRIRTKDFPPRFFPGVETTSVEHICRSPAGIFQAPTSCCQLSIPGIDSKAPKDIHIDIYIYIHISNLSNLSIYLSIDLSIYLCIYLSMHLCIYASMHLCIYASMHMYPYNYRFHRSDPPTAHLSGLLAFLHYLHWVPLSSRCPSPTHSKTAQRSAWSHPKGEGLRVAWSWLICLYRVWVVAVLLDLGTSWNHFRSQKKSSWNQWIGLWYSCSRTKISPFWGGLTAHVLFSTFWDAMILPRRYVHPDTAASRHAGPPALQKGHERITKSLLLNPLPTDLDLFSSGSREYTSKSTAECSCWGAPLGVPPTASPWTCWAMLGPDLTWV